MATIPVAEHDYLDQDPPIRGQKYACVSFLSPEDALARKDVFEFGSFMRSVGRDIQDLLQNIQLRFGGADDKEPDAEEAKAKEETPDAEIEPKEEAPDAEIEPKEEAPDAVVPASGTSIAAGAEETAALIKKHENAQYVRETIRILRERYGYLRLGQEGDDELQAEFAAYRQRHAGPLDDEFRARHGAFKTTVRGFKIRGVYDSVDDASQRAKYIKRFDKNFNVYVAEVGCWCPWNPNPDEIQDAQYDEEHLNTLMKKYVEGQDHRDELYASRKDNLVRDIADDRDAWIKTQQERLAAAANGKPVNADVPSPPNPPVPSPPTPSVTITEEGEGEADVDGTKGAEVTAKTAAAVEEVTAKIDGMDVDAEDEGVLVDVV